MNNHFLTYGIAAYSLEQVCQRLEQLLNISFEERESVYLGKYLFYKGDEADRLTIESNFFDGEWKLEAYSNYPILVKASILNGSETDKVEKKSLLKNLLEKDRHFQMLKDRVIISR